MQHRDVLNYSLKGGEIVARGADKRAFDLDTLFAAVEDVVDSLIGQFAHGRFERSLILIQQRLYFPENHAILSLS